MPNFTFSISRHMDEIPIAFQHEGKHYKGNFSEVSGAGAATWHLMIDHYYCGKLRLNDRGWFFDPTPKTESFEKLADFFGEYITLWYS